MAAGGKGWQGEGRAALMAAKRSAVRLGGWPGGVSPPVWQDSRHLLVIPTPEARRLRASRRDASAPLRLRRSAYFVFLTNSASMPWILIDTSFSTGMPA